MASKHGLQLLDKPVFIGSLLLGEKEDLGELVRLAGGKVATSMKSAALSLGSYDQREWERLGEKKKLPMVREKWLFGECFYSFLLSFVIHSFIHFFLSFDHSSRFDHRVQEASV